VNRYPLLSKTVVIGLLTLLLTIPLLMIGGVITERSQYREQAAREVARAHAGEQLLSGPVLHVPYTETWVRTVEVNAARNTRRQETVQEKRVLTLFPATLDTRSRLVTETRWRGIFPVTVYNSRHDSSGRFVWPGITPREKGGQIQLGQPVVLLGVSDLRGLMGQPELRVQGQSLTMTAAPAQDELPLPLAAPLTPSVLQAGATLDFTLGLDLAGTGRIGYLPLAGENRVSLESAWPHPSFDGAFLPRTREVGEGGFKATWSVPALSTQAQQQFLANGAEREAIEDFSVALQDPVDVYRLSERATKYGLMFIVLTFAMFFVLEMVKRWRIHPMQYLMIGAALVLFFLLLLSLSEHLDFHLAYALASLACMALLSHYLRHVLGGWRAGLRMGGMLAALYGVLYGILVSEDNALMMGSLLLFGALAAIMIVTRRLDWYNVMGRDGDRRAQQQAVPVAHN
jgi:inner membrane protein